MTPESEIAAAFAAVLRDRADEVLLVAPSESRCCTATDVHDEASRVAGQLQRAGLARGHLVIASAGNRSAMPALVLACLREGLPLMPVDRSTPPAEIGALATRWDAAAVVVADSTFLEASSPASDCMHAGSGLNERTSAGQVTMPWIDGTTRTTLAHGLAMYVPARIPDPGRHSPAAMLKLTSGTTGVPRATSSEERHLLADVRQVVSAMDIRPRDRQLGVIPLSHSYGFTNLLLPLLLQGTALWLRPQFVPTQVVPDIESAGLATFAGVPYMFEHLARHHARPLAASVRLVLSAGARLPFETVRAFHEATGRKIKSLYGTSETGGICFDGSDVLDERVPVGMPMGATVVTLVDDPDAPPGTGRVQVSGPSVIDRYAEPAIEYDDDRRDRAAPGGTFLTGDYARVDANGVYVLAGRAATFVNVAGRKVQPQEVEAAIRDLPGVRDVVALAVDDEVRGQALGACIAGTRDWNARAIREALSARLAPYKLPRIVVVVDALPLTDRGKIDRAAIARLLGQA